jgi:branched-chain amino acid transport system substrate-binding protein
MKIRLVTGLVLAALAFSANAQIKIGLSLATTGPAASLGIPEKNTVPLYPTTIAGQKIEYIVLDDASDTTTARKNVEKLTSEDKVDAIIGPSTSPTVLAAIEVAAKSQTPMIALGAAIRIVQPMDDQKRWIFKTPYNDTIVAEATAIHMAKNGMKNVGHIGFNEAYGESWLAEFKKAADKHGVKITASETYSPKDTSVTAQILKIMATNPQAVLIVGAGTPAVLPQATLVERGYKGKIYQTAGVINNDFLRVGGKNVEGTLLPSGPVIVVDQLPDSNPAKKPAMEYKTKYEAKNGPGTLTTFGANGWDAMLIIERAIPEALKKGKPGTVEFRTALRDGIENVRNLPTTHGMLNMSPTDHNGYAPEAAVIVTITNGKWTYAK